MKPEYADVKEKNKVQPPKKNGRQQRRDSIINSGETSKTNGPMARNDPPHSNRKSPGIDAEGKEQESHANPEPIEEKAKEQDGQTNPEPIEQEKAEEQHTNDPREPPAQWEGPKWEKDN